MPATPGRWSVPLGSWKPPASTHPPSRFARSVTPPPPRTVFLPALPLLLLAAAPALAQTTPNTPPFRYVYATAYHILPETHSDESGYFSLNEGKNGKVYVGTAKYG